MARTPDLQPPVKQSPARIAVEADIGRATTLLKPYGTIQGIDGVLDTAWQGVKDRLQILLDRAKSVWATGKAKAKEAAEKARDAIGRAAKRARDAVGKASDLWDDFSRMYNETQRAATVWGLAILAVIVYAAYKWETRGRNRR